MWVKDVRWKLTHISLFRTKSMKLAGLSKKKAKNFLWKAYSFLNLSTRRNPNLFPCILSNLRWLQCAQVRKNFENLSFFFFIIYGFLLISSSFIFRVFRLCLNFHISVCIHVRNEHLLYEWSITNLCELVSYMWASSYDVIYLQIREVDFYSPTHVMHVCIWIFIHKNW